MKDKLQIPFLLAGSEHPQFPEEESANVEGETLVFLKGIISEYRTFVSSCDFRQPESTRDYRIRMLSINTSSIHVELLDSYTTLIESSWFLCTWIGYMLHPILCLITSLP